MEDRLEAHNEHGFIPWSLQQPPRDTLAANEQRRCVWSNAGWYMEVPAEVACIVCFDEAEGTERGLADWHHCRTCSAMWCGSCMEQMYNEARDNVEHPERELSCPQCRKSIAEMQLDARLERLTALGCSTARDAMMLLGYENLLTVALHLCEAHADGMPYYTLPPEVSARVLSRDETCDVVAMSLGRAEDARLRRQLRSGDYVAATLLVLQGYAGQLRASLRPPAVLAALQPLARYLSAAAECEPRGLRHTPAILERRAALLAGVERQVRVLEGEALQAANPEEARRQPRAASGRSSRKRRRG